MLFGYSAAACGPTVFFRNLRKRVENEIIEGASMDKRSKGRDGGNDRWAADNDHQAGAVQSGERGDLALWSKRCLIPLVRFLARRAAERDFEKAANDNKRPRE
jgi:hypothetical protein